MRKFIRVVLFCIETILIFLVVGAVTTAITKNIHSYILIEQFKSKGVLNEEKSTDNIKIYEIESDENLLSYTNGKSDIYPGNSGDILINLKSEINIPIVEEIISFFAGGHAAIVLDDLEDISLYANSNKVVETTGLEAGNNPAIIGAKESWNNRFYYKEVVGLRVKMTDLERKKVISKAISLVGDPYNYSFIVDTLNKSYCSDLVMKAFSSIGVNLNKDGFTTSVYDLIVSNETYISYYQYYDTNDVRHIYYLV